MIKIHKWLKSLWKDKTLIFMALPAVFLLILFNYVPMTGLVLAFKKFSYSLGLYQSPLNGLENFKHLFLAGEAYWRITRNTVLYYLLFTVAGTIMNVTIAISINELAFKKAGKYMQSVMIMPTFISYVAVSYVVKALLSYDKGMINDWIASAGGERINFYLKAIVWPLILLLVKIWRDTGYGSVLYLSVLTGIDPEMYDAASIDGANSGQRLRYITIPLLIPTVIVMTLIGLGNIMHSDTGLFYQVTQNSGALYSTTQVLDSYVYGSIVSATNSGTNYGSIAATTFYQSVIGCLLLVIVNKAVRKVSPENALF